MSSVTAPTGELAANRLNIRPGRIIAWTLLFIGGLIMVSPLLFMFSTSLKTAGQVYDLRLIPAAPTLDN
jgi:multiple sugar transport system permease protein